MDVNDTISRCLQRLALSTYPICEFGILHFHLQLITFLYVFEVFVCVCVCVPVCPDSCIERVNYYQCFEVCS